MSIGQALRIVSDEERTAQTDQAFAELEASIGALTDIGRATEDAKDIRARSASAAAESLRKSTEKVIGVLETRRNAQIDQIRSDYMLRRQRDNASLASVEAAKAEALRIATINAEQAATIQANLARDADMTDALITTETNRYNGMIALQRDMLDKF